MCPPSFQVRTELREREGEASGLRASSERLDRARRLLERKHLLQLKELNRR